jgi:hypothetical protein
MMSKQDIGIFIMFAFFVSLAVRHIDYLLGF